MDTKSNLSGRFLHAKTIQPEGLFKMEIDILFPKKLISSILTYQTKKSEVEKGCPKGLF
jgi:hypothetical protein